MSYQSPTEPDLSLVGDDGSASILFPIPSKHLSVDAIRHAITEACDKTNERLGNDALARVVTVNGTSSMLSILGLLDKSEGDEQQPNDLPNFDLVQGIILEQSGRVVGFATVYWAYSTWDGRYLYINKIVAPDQRLETSMLYTLAEVALCLEGQRLVWQHYDDKLPFYKSLAAETLEGWLTLRMSAEGMDSFLESRDMTPPKGLARSTFTEEGTRTDEECVLDAVEVSNRKSDKVQLHLATENDLAHVERLVDGLAVYDKEVDVIHVNREHYLVDGFNGEMPLYKCLLLQNKDDGYFCGMAFFYFGYDIERGRFLYLEDLFIEEEHRRQGGGSLVMATLASIAKRTGCTGFVWQALDWSTAALDFYDSIGGKIMNGRLTTRFSGDALKQFVSCRPPNL